MDKEKAIGILNTLIEINNDRIQGYETALTEAENADFKTMFFLLLQNSKRCRAELISEVLKLGGTAIEGTKITGNFFSIWMSTKAVLKSKGDNVKINLLDNWGSGFAIDTYNEILKNNLKDMSEEQRAIICKQHALIKTDYANVMRIKHGERMSN